MVGLLVSCNCAIIVIRAAVVFVIREGPEDLRRRVLPFLEARLS